jgi:hypothetical protein
MTTEKPEEVLLPGVYQVIEQATKPVVANLDGFEELKLNLKSFFAISPADDFEIDQVSFFLSDFRIPTNTNTDLHVRLVSP